MRLVLRVMVRLVLLLLLWGGKQVPREIFYRPQAIVQRHDTALVIQFSRMLRWGSLLHRVKVMMSLVIAITIVIVQLLVDQCLARASVGVMDSIWLILSSCFIYIVHI